MSIAALTLQICTIMDKGGDDFSMGIFGIDQSFSDSDEHCVGIAQDIYESITRNRNDEVYGDYSDTDCDDRLEKLAEQLKEALEEIALFDSLPEFSAKTEDGRYGADADHQMWKIHPNYFGLGYVVGSIHDLRNIEVAADAADDEARILMAQAKKEFGF